MEAALTAIEGPIDHPVKPRLVNRVQEHALPFALFVRSQLHAAQKPACGVRNGFPHDWQGGPYKLRR